MAISDTQPAPAPAPAPLVARPRVRYIGIDLARFIAIVGMMSAHLLTPMVFFPTSSEAEKGLAGTVALIANGAPAALFAVLGGVSIVFATRRQLREGQVGKAIASIAVRGVVLLVLGVLLGFVSTGIIVVLAYYGVAMILVAPLIAARGWVLASIASILGLVFGWLNIGLRRAIEVRMEGPFINVKFFVEDPLGALRALFITGEYPAITWATYLLVGILIGRALTSATARGELGRTAAKFAAVGAGVFVVAQLVSNWILDNLATLGVVTSESMVKDVQFELLQVGGSGAPPGTTLLAQLIAVPHSGSIMDLIRTIALAMLVIGALVWLCDRERTPKLAAAAESLPAPSPGIGARLLDVVRAAGAAPLTIYTAHIVTSGILSFATSHMNTENGYPWWAFGPGALLVQVLGALVIGAILSVTKRRGPLETVFAKIVGLVVR